LRRKIELFFYSLWIHTMNRCTPLPGTSRRLRLLAALFAVGFFCAAPVTAQVQTAPGNLRNFPEAALRGTLIVNGMYDAQLDGKAIRMAPGMRLLSPQNALVQAHTVINQSLTVNYVKETSTGMLLTAWILSQTEAAQKRAGQDNARNFFFQSETATAR